MRCYLAVVYFRFKSRMLDKVTLSKVIWQVAQEEDREVKLKREPFERMRSSLFIL